MDGSDRTGNWFVEDTAMKKQQTQKPDQQTEEWKSKYLRALADYQNLEKRSAVEKQEVRRYAEEVLLTRLLPVVDTFEQAQAHLHDKGLGLALRELFAVLDEQGVTRIETVGKEFNPHEMECTEVVEGQENRVVFESLPGYRLRDKVLRVAQVKVGKKQTDS